MRGYIVDASIPSGAGRCPECGAVVEAGAPEGLCPRCLARVGLGTWAGDASAELPVAETVSLGRFADYELIEEIGHGGMGTVYKARQLSLNRVVALKMLLGGQYAEAQARARFRAEAEIAAQLQHPHIVAIHEVGEHDGLPFFTMDYIEGQNLADLAQQQPLPAAAAAAYVQTIALAIQYAHEQGVLHRDLKPSNILIDTADQPRVTDFGLAKRLTGSTSDLTVSGQALGSPNFMSPEQASGKHRTVGPTSDIYGLGAILYYLVTSRPPFLADNVGVAVRQVQEQEPVAPRLLNPGVPRDLETLCLKCLQKDPRQRYGSAVELAEELGRFLRGEPIRARPVGRLERVWRWSRRRPGLATLAGVVVALAAVSTTVAVRMVIAQEARDRAQEGMERELYRASIQRATTHLEAGDTELALATLLECPPKFRHWEWGYLVAQCHRAVLNLEDAVDPALRSTGAEWVMSAEPWSCGFDPAGKRVAAIRPSSGIWVWELPSGKLVLHVRPPAAREAGLLLTPDWSQVVYAPTNQPEVVCVVPLGQTNVMRRLEGHTVGIRRLGISPDGHWVAAWAADGTVRIWDLESGAMQAVLPALSGIQRLQFTADNRRLMAVGSTFLAVFDVQSGERVRWVDHRPDQARGVFPSANAEQWVTADASNRFRLWSAGKPAQNLGRLDADDDDPAKQAVFSPDGRRLCVAGDYSTATVFDLRTGERHMPVPAQVYAAVFSPDGTQLATMGRLSSIQIWDLERRREVFSLRGHTESLHGFAFSPDSRLLVSVSWMGAVKVWSGKPGRELFHGVSFIEDVTQTADGKRMAFTDCYSVRICDTETGAQLAQFRRARRDTHGCHFSPDGRWIAVGGIVVGETAIWEVATGRLMKVLRGHPLSAFTARFSPDGHHLLTSCFAGILKLWDVATWQEVYTIQEPGLLIFNEAAFSPNGRHLATMTWSTNHTVAIRDAATGRCLHVLRGHNDIPWNIAWSPDGHTLATSSRDRTIRFWDVHTGQFQRQWQVRGRCCRLAYSPDGRRMVLRTNQGDSGAGDACTTEIWDVLSGQTLLVFRGHGEMAATLAFLTDGRRILADWWDWTTLRQYEAFPWQEEEYPGSPGEKLTARMRRYAQEYWWNRLEAEKRGAQGGGPLVVKLPMDPSLFHPRDPDTPAQRLDLSAYFTSPVQEMSYVDYGFAQECDLRYMPRGQVAFHGVDFDVRGIIQLKRFQSRGSVWTATWEDMPEAVRGVAVGQRFRRLHLLLGTDMPTDEGLVIGSLILNYSDGRHQEFEICYGRHVRTAQTVLDPKEVTDQAQVAWEGKDPFRELSVCAPIWSYARSTLRVYQTAWENPRPEVEVVSLDLVSKMTDSAPFVIAVTVE